MTWHCLPHGGSIATSSVGSCGAEESASDVTVWRVEWVCHEAVVLANAGAGAERMHTFVITSRAVPSQADKDGPKRAWNSKVASSNVFDAHKTYPGVTEA